MRSSILAIAALLIATTACGNAADAPATGDSHSDAAHADEREGEHADADTPADAAHAVAEAAEAGGDSDSLPDLTEWLVGEGHSGTFTLAWRPLGGGDVPRNREFTAEVIVLEGDAPRPDLRVELTAYMPAHDHGLVQTPVVTEVGNGRYRIDGVLLHMRGHWQVRFTLLTKGLLETVTFEMDL